ncbi:MAG: hypothetical protein V1760_01230, partial [Candidatus Peregrinibacteria bacterium]
MGKQLPKKMNAVCVVKTAVCILLFLVALALFAYACRDLVNNFLWILSPSLKTTVSWLIRVSVYALLLGIMVGVVTVLVRPVWLAFATYLVAALIFPLIVGFGTATWITAGVFFLLLSLYLTYITGQLKNQIHFSSHPLSDMKVILFLVLTVLASVAVAMSYTKDSVQRNYIFPPEVKGPVIELLVTQAKPLVMAQAPASATAKQKDVAMQAVRQKIQSFVDDGEKKIQPYQSAIAPVLGVFAFSLLSIVFLVLAFLSVFILTPLFFLLRITHFVNVA